MEIASRNYDEPPRNYQVIDRRDIFTISSLYPSTRRIECTFFFTCSIRFSRQLQTFSAYAYLIFTYQATMAIFYFGHLSRLIRVMIQCVDIAKTIRPRAD